MTDIADGVVARNQLCDANEFQIPALPSASIIYLSLSFFFPSSTAPGCILNWGHGSIFIQQLRR